jgi:hypothetical protein
LGSVVIDSTFVSTCVIICKQHFVKYIVAPAKADMQVKHWQDAAVPVCRDSNKIAYGKRYVIFINNWHLEQFCAVDLNVPVTAEMEKKTASVLVLLLLRIFHHSLVGVHHRMRHLR